VSGTKVTLGTKVKSGKKVTSGGIVNVDGKIIWKCGKIKEVR